MKIHQALIQSHSLEPLGSPAVWVKWAGQPPKPTPGQAFLIEPPHPHELADVCLPLKIGKDALLIEAVENKVWAPGAPIFLWGPMGKPFDPPASCQKWLLLAPESHLGKLLPLVELGLQRGVSLAAWANQPLASLAPAVEILPDASEGIAWADYIAIELGESDLSQNPSLPLGDLDHARATKIEALITPPMPCGFGGCGICAVKAKRGWHRACLDGPVFDWKSLGS